MSDEKLTPDPTFKRRAWQSRAIELCKATAESGSDRALIYACPGSGKTFAGLLIARELSYSRFTGAKIIVLTPNLAIKTQWIERAATLGIRLLPVKSFEDLRQIHLAIEDVGFILSYQQAVSLKLTLKQYCEANRPIVVLDEIHHSAGPREERDGNVWGHSVELAFGSARFKLCTTGTPFREGNNPISFVQYGSDHAAIALVTYTYESAIRDGVCRPIEFMLFDGTIRWQNKGEPIAVTFQDVIDDKLNAQRLRAALAAKGDHLKAILTAANDRLVSIRAGTSCADRTAAGLVVAMDTKHAGEIAEQLRLISGETPTVVHSKIDEAQDAIDDFRESDAMWIIGINMLSEGVDIPRLRVGVYASNIRASLYFHQFCGRFARVVDDRSERSYIFMPADGELEAIALTIEQDRVHALGEEFAGRLTRVNVGGGRRKGFVEGSSTGEPTILLGGGLKLPIDYVRQHQPRIREFRMKDSTRIQMSDVEVLKIMIDLDAVAPPVWEAA